MSLRQRQGKDLTMIGGREKRLSPDLCPLRSARLGEREGLALVVSEQFFGPPLTWYLRAMRSPFRYFNSSPEVIRLVVMMYLRYPLSLRNVEDLLAERGIDISHETVQFWWNRFGPMFAAEIRTKRVAHLRSFPQWRWHLDECS